MPAVPQSLHVTGIAHDLRGVAKCGSETWFIEGALPGEQVEAVAVARKQGVVEARLVSVSQASPWRVEPACPHYARCGGCHVQHVSHAGQVALKQDAVLQQLARIARLEPARVLAPQLASPWGYRSRARLGIRRLPDGSVAVGLRARRSHEVIPIEGCPVLVPALQAVLAPLQACLGGWSQPRQLGHVDLLHEGGAVQVGLRVLSAPVPADRARLQALVDAHGVEVTLVQGSEEAPTVVALSGSVPSVRPDHFLQANAEANPALVEAALSALALQPEDRVLEAFCGMGNFTLPMARRGAAVLGLEGVPEMVERARGLAAEAGLAQVQFRQANLEQGADLGKLSGFTRILLDPPRTGARHFCQAVALAGVKRLVYVSCHPSTLARDAAVLAQRGWELDSLQLVDMFPQTWHTECVAAFQPGRRARPANGRRPRGVSR